VPTYEYRARDEKRSCERCRAGFEVVHGMTDEGPKACPQCGAPVERAIQAPHIKGDRWSSRRLLDKDHVRRHGFRTGSDLLESGEV
jgi:putative FmdB family regulatory protein